MHTRRILVSLLIAAGAALGPAIGEARDFQAGTTYSNGAFVPVQSRGQYVWDGHGYVWQPYAYQERVNPYRYEPSNRGSVYAPQSTGWRRHRGYWGDSYRNHYADRDYVANPADDRGGRGADRD